VTQNNLDTWWHGTSKLQKTYTVLLHWKI